MRQSHNLQSLCWRIRAVLAIITPAIVYSQVLHAVAGLQMTAWGRGSAYVVICSSFTYISELLTSYGSSSTIIERPQRTTTQQSVT